MVKMIEDIKCPYCGEELDVEAVDCFNDFDMDVVIFHNTYQCFKCKSQWEYKEVYELKSAKNIK